MLGGIIWWKELKQAGVVNTVKTMWLKQVELSFIERIIHWHESVSWCWDSWKIINNFPISSSNSEKTDSESVGDKSTWKCQLKWRLRGGEKGSSTVLFARWGRVNTTVNERMKQITRVRSNVSQHITLPLNKYCLLLLLLWANPPPSPPVTWQSLWKATKCKFNVHKATAQPWPTLYLQYCRGYSGRKRLLHSSFLAPVRASQGQGRGFILFYFVSTWQRLSGFCQSNFHVFHTPRASIILSLHSIPAASSVGKTPNWNYEYFEHNRRGSAKLSSAGTCTIGAEISHASHDSPQLWWEHGAEGALS